MARRSMRPADVITRGGWVFEVAHSVSVGHVAWRVRGGLFLALYVRIDGDVCMVRVWYG